MAYWHQQHRNQFKQINTTHRRVVKLNLPGLYAKSAYKEQTVQCLSRIHSSVQLEQWQSQLHLPTMNSPSVHKNVCTNRQSCNGTCLDGQNCTLRIKTVRKSVSLHNVHTAAIMQQHVPQDSRMETVTSCDLRIWASVPRNWANMRQSIVYCWWPIWNRTTLSTSPQQGCGSGGKQNLTQCWWKYRQWFSVAASIPNANPVVELTHPNSRWRHRRL